MQEQIGNISQKTESPRLSKINSRYKKYFNGNRISLMRSSVHWTRQRKESLCLKVQTECKENREGRGIGQKKKRKRIFKNCGTISKVVTCVI